MMGICDNLVATLSSLTRPAFLDNPGVQLKPGAHVIEGVFLRLRLD